MKEDLFPTHDVAEAEAPISWERKHQNFEQRFPKDYFNTEKAKGYPLQLQDKSRHGNPWAANAPLFPNLGHGDEPPLQEHIRKPLSLSPGKNELPGDEPMPKPIKPTGEGVYSANEPFPNPFSDVGKYIPQSPSGKPDPNDALKFWEHPSPKVIPIREGRVEDIIETLKARGFRLTPVDHDPFAAGPVQVAGDVVRFPGRSQLLDKELAQSPEQVAKNRTSRILNQTLQTPNVLPINPDKNK